MQLKVTTDYAVRTLLYLAEKKGQATAGEIAKDLAIPKNYVPKIMESLREEKLVHSQSGVNGGYSLAKRPEDISVFQVLNLMESTVKMNRCLEDDHYCSRCATKHCAVHRLFDEMQTEMETKLKSTTIATLLQAGNRENRTKRLYKKQKSENDE